MTDDLAALFAYDRWAEARLIDACRPVPPDRYGAEPAPGWAPLRATVAHVVGATELWLRRFLGEPADGFIPEAQLATPDAVAARSAANHDAFDRLIAGLTPEQASAPFTYRNIKGEVATLPLWAALRHVANHATYHRGQAASKLKLLGVRAARDRPLAVGHRAIQAGLNRPARPPAPRSNPARRPTPMTVVTLSLPDHLREFVEAQVAEGGHASADAYLLAVLEDVRKHKAMQGLIAKLDEALASGPATPMTREDWDDIERSVWERHGRDSIESRCIPPRSRAPRGNKFRRIGIPAGGPRPALDPPHE